jgi:hypothetical protein
MPKINPGRAVAKATRRSVKGASSAGRMVLDLTAAESALLAEAVKEGLRLPLVPRAVTGILAHRVDTVIEMMKGLLDAAAGQILAALDSYLEGRGLTAETSVAELIRRGIVGFVELEKQFLDLVAEEVAAAAEAWKNGRKPSRERNKVLTKLARQAVDEFINTQKKLLDLAIQEIGESEDVEEPEVAAKPVKRTTIAELTQRSVQNLVTAQKSLLDLTVKPIKTPHPPAKAAKPVKTARKTARKSRAA